MSLTLKVKLHIHLLNVVVRFIVFLTSATTIFRGTDILKCSESPLEFEITRVDCNSKFKEAVYQYLMPIRSPVTDNS